MLTIYKLTPSNDGDHDEHESSSTSQDLHEACSPDCWQESKKQSTLMLATGRYKKQIDT